MVMQYYERENIEKQKLILSKIMDTNLDILDEYEAMKLIRETMVKLKEDNNLTGFNIDTYVKDVTTVKWKNNSKVKYDFFIKYFYNEIEYIKDTYGVTNSEVSFLMFISLYLGWQNNLLVTSEGLPINQKMLVELTGLNRKTIYNNMKSLEEKKCVIRIWDGKEVYYIINPSMMYKGQQINMSIVKLFEMLGYVQAKDNKKYNSDAND